MHRLRYGVEAYDEEFPEPLEKMIRKWMSPWAFNGTQCTQAGEV
uniref:Uncharacterized protein n=1 Tax=Utricularia reniformis TaxID=192314 RepID=A0A1Y0B4N6_9LAMI|nr:hypothetical protein AEK19_MT2190 [Utricularia reniformis]ART32337.1 hypothetical protein AEK19_MT2190 [Utricularia reniformis]